MCVRVLVSVPRSCRFLYSNAGQTDKFKEALTAATSTGVPWAMSMTRRRQDVMDKKEVRHSWTRRSDRCGEMGGRVRDALHAAVYVAVRSVNEMLLMLSWR